MPVIAGGADERGIARIFAEQAASERRKSCETAHSPDPIRTSEAPSIVAWFDFDVPGERSDFDIHLAFAAHGDE